MSCHQMQWWFDMLQDWYCRVLPWMSNIWTNIHVAAGVEEHSGGTDLTSVWPLYCIHCWIQSMPMEPKTGHLFAVYLEVLVLPTIWPAGLQTVHLLVGTRVMIGILKTRFWWWAALQACQDGCRLNHVSILVSIFIWELHWMAQGDLLSAGHPQMCIWVFQQLLCGWSLTSIARRNLVQ